MAVSFIIFIAFGTFFTIFFVRGKSKWNDSLGILATISLSDYKEFKDLKINSDSYGLGEAEFFNMNRVGLGSSIDGVMYINDNEIIKLVVIKPILNCPFVI